MFASNHAQRVFPCFDQPDLKATFQVTMEGPLMWLYLQNMDFYKLEQQKDNPSVGKENIRCYFNKTPILSTYLLAIAVGNWVCVTQKAD